MTMGANLLNRVGRELFPDVHEGKLVLRKVGDIKSGRVGQWPKESLGRLLQFLNDNPIATQNVDKDHLGILLTRIHVYRLDQSDQKEGGVRKAEMEMARHFLQLNGYPNDLDDEQLLFVLDSGVKLSDEKEITDILYCFDDIGRDELLRNAAITLLDGITDIEEKSHLLNECRSEYRTVLKDIQEVCPKLLSGIKEVSEKYKILEFLKKIEPKERKELLNSFTPLLVMRNLKGTYLAILSEIPPKERLEAITLCIPYLQKGGGPEILRNWRELKNLDKDLYEKLELVLEGNISQLEKIGIVFELQHTPLQVDKVTFAKLIFGYFRGTTPKEKLEMIKEFSKVTDINQFSNFLVKSKSLTDMGERGIDKFVIAKELMSFPPEHVDDVIHVLKEIFSLYDVKASCFRDLHQIPKEDFPLFAQSVHQLEPWTIHCALSCAESFTTSFWNKIVSLNDHEERGFIFRAIYALEEEDKKRFVEKFSTNSKYDLSELVTYYSIFSDEDLEQIGWEHLDQELIDGQSIYSEDQILREKTLALLLTRLQSSAEVFESQLEMYKMFAQEKLDLNPMEDHPLNEAIRNHVMNFVYGPADKCAVLKEMLPYLSATMSISEQVSLLNSLMEFSLRDLKKLVNFKEYFPYLESLVDEGRVAFIETILPYSVDELNAYFKSLNFLRFEEKMIVLEYLSLVPEKDRPKHLEAFINKLRENSDNYFYKTLWLYTLFPLGFIEELDQTTLNANLIEKEPFSSIFQEASVQNKALNALFLRLEQSIQNRHTLGVAIRAIEDYTSKVMGIQLAEDDPLSILQVIAKHVHESLDNEKNPIVVYEMVQDRENEQQDLMPTFQQIPKTIGQQAVNLNMERVRKAQAKIFTKIFPMSILVTWKRSIIH